MAIKDFKVDTGIAIDGVSLSLPTTNSGGIVYQSSTSSFISTVGNIPVGVVRMWTSNTGSATPPDDYLICAGQQDLSKTTYADLYAVIGDRFTVTVTTPPSSTFGLPSFNNTTTGTYPIGIGHDKANDIANSAKPLATTKDIGALSQTSHEHTTGSAYSINTTNATASHSHTFSNTASHSHASTNTNVDGSHSHTASNASNSQAHAYQAGGTAATTSQASGNHDHTGYGIKQNHSHVSAVVGANHQHVATQGASGGNTTSHSHAVQASLNGVLTTHSHTINSSGFYYIIKYR